MAFDKGKKEYLQPSRTLTNNPGKEPYGQPWNQDHPSL